MHFEQSRLGVLISLGVSTHLWLDADLVPLLQIEIRLCERSLDIQPSPNSRDPLMHPTMQLLSDAQHTPPDAGACSGMVSPSRFVV